MSKKHNHTDTKLMREKILENQHFKEIYQLFNHTAKIIEYLNIYQQIEEKIFNYDELIQFQKRALLKSIFYSPEDFIFIPQHLLSKKNSNKIIINTFCFFFEGFDYCIYNNEIYLIQYHQSYKDTSSLHKVQKIISNPFNYAFGFEFLNWIKNRQISIFRHKFYFPIIQKLTPSLFFHHLFWNFGTKTSATIVDEILIKRLKNFKKIKQQIKANYVSNKHKP